MEDPTKRCCATCADDECGTHRIRYLSELLKAKKYMGNDLKTDFCIGNGYCLWKQIKMKEG